MKKVTMQKLLRITAVLIFIIGAGIGYDMADKQIVGSGFFLRTSTSGWPCCAGSSPSPWAFCFWLRPGSWIF